jgi:predicted signal transduction protein with EAL and GGDEF domain
MVRDGDTIARLGGDEFAVLLLGVCDVMQATKLADRIVQSICEPFEISGLRLSIGVSIGIALAPSDGEDRGQLMKYADLALYRAKDEGRGTWRFFEPAMNALAQKRCAIEADLRAALGAEQLELHYQPFVSSHDRRVSGFEALVRWRHPIRGLVSPADFIPVAEETGLIIEIGDWVLKRACEDAATWPEHLKVAVNLSTRQFSDPALVRKVAEAIRAAGIAPERLELEITESLPLLQDRVTLSTLKDLHALGVTIALDDFGTGYSSLSYLRGFPFDRIKIDRSFVIGLQRDGTGIGIIAGIVGLAANLHMDITAEGVETEFQFELLAAAGCQEIQGFHMSKPVPACAVPALIDHLSARTAGPAIHLAWSSPGALLADREPAGAG